MPLDRRSVKSGLGWMKCSVEIYASCERMR